LLVKRKIKSFCSISCSSPMSLRVASKLHRD
jgi:hypothetical protein